MTNVLALDPGEGTGWAWFQHTILLPAALQAQGVIPNGVEGFMRATVTPDYFLHGLMMADVVVYEDFEIDGTITGSWSSEVIGALKMWQYERGSGPLVRQRRQDKAALFGQKAPTTELREAERFNWLRERGFTGVSHELDAITHGLFYIKKQNHVPTIRKYWTDWSDNA